MLGLPLLYMTFAWEMQKSIQGPVQASFYFTWGHQRWLGKDQGPPISRA